MIFRVSLQIRHDSEKIFRNCTRPKIAARRTRRRRKFRSKSRIVHAFIDVGASEGFDFVTTQKSFARLPTAEAAQFRQRVEVVDKVLAEIFNRRRRSRLNFCFGRQRLQIPGAKPKFQLGDKNRLNQQSFNVAPAFVDKEIIHVANKLFRIESDAFRPKFLSSVETFDKNFKLVQAVNGHTG